MPLWASIGPRTTSPTAQTFGTPVRQWSSTSMKPRLSTGTLTSGREQPGRDRPPADRDHERVDLELLRRAAALEAHLDDVALDVRAGNLGAHPDVEALALEVPHSFLRDLLIGRGQERLERFEHDDFRAEPAPDAAELEPDDAGPDHAEPLRDAE